ncbi:MAG: hypothetical protein HN548_01250 [Opitutae bacterium]|jgi:hypothetical protein|nr:hypothetical protein [Opitutae bacterium]MBT5715427.1 hypothetical protein [Opitutae bacterium]
MNSSLMTFLDKAWFWVYLLFSLSCSDQGDITEVSSTRESISLSKEAKQGRHVFKDGSIYEGELVMGKPNGYGTRELVNGNIFEGQHKDGYSHGHGTMRYKSDEKLDRYVGNWRSGKRHGFGTLILHDSSRLIGDWKNDVFNYGEYQGSNGVIMSGQWDSEYLKEGTMRLEDGSEFSGEFIEDGLFGHGSLLSVNGDRYTGRFQNNEYFGSGILQKVGGTVFVGSFKNGKFEGYGILKEVDGSIYSGAFSDGSPHGDGIQSDNSGVVYSGSWANGDKDGLGTLDFGDGTSYTGRFKLGLAFEGVYDWGDGIQTDSYQDENGNWLDRE